MRFLSILSALFVLLLTAKPCCADTDCDRATAVANTTSTSSQTNDKDCQGCSPFFSCGVCSGFIVANSSQYTLLVVPAMPIEHQSAYRQPYTEEIALAIWQPPQLS